jgi:endonuclease-3
MPTSPETKKRAARIFRKLAATYPEATCALTHANPFQLLVATILSAQCTDERVNMVTPGLFRRYPTPAAMAAATQEEIEEVIRSTGFYRNKAQSIREASAALVEEFGGEVPRTMAELLRLRGVARKTANVVLGNAFGLNEGVVVDTHVGRLSRRMGFTTEKAPEKVERDLVDLFPRKDWTLLAHLMIWHGRKQCSARKPLCEACPVGKDCPRVGAG